jgi:hypothetical protein
MPAWGPGAKLSSPVLDFFQAGDDKLSSVIWAVLKAGLGWLSIGIVGMERGTLVGGIVYMCTVYIFGE